MTDLIDREELWRLLDMPVVPAAVLTVIGSMPSVTCATCKHVRHHGVLAPYMLCRLGACASYDSALPDGFSCNQWEER